MAELRLWLVGRGIAASPSPAMHNAALAACGLRGRYELREATEAELPAVAARLRAGDVRGANVTIPHKMRMARECDRLVGEALPLGAVNTLTGEGPELVGENTDVRGFELALRERGLWPEPGARSVVLGAGGAAAAVVLALGRVAGAGTVVSSRRLEAAQALGARLDGLVPVRVEAWAGRGLERCLAEADLVVNATPARLGQLPLDVDRLPAACAVVDLRYRPRPVDLVAAAAASGRRAADGVEMLLQQGMLSFAHWTGCEPPYEAARSALARALSP